MWTKMIDRVNNINTKSLRMVWLSFRYVSWVIVLSLSLCSFHPLPTPFSLSHTCTLFLKLLHRAQWWSFFLVTFSLDVIRCPRIQMTSSHAIFWKRRSNAVYDHLKIELPGITCVYDYDVFTRIGCEWLIFQQILSHAAPASCCPFSWSLPLATSSSTSSTKADSFLTGFAKGHLLATPSAHPLVFFLLPESSLRSLLTCHLRVAFWHPLMTTSAPFVWHSWHSSQYAVFSWSTFGFYVSTRVCVCVGACGALPALSTGM